MCCRHCQGGWYRRVAEEGAPAHLAPCLLDLPTLAGTPLTPAVSRDFKAYVGANRSNVMVLFGTCSTWFFLDIAYYAQ